MTDTKTSNSKLKFYIRDEENPDGKPFATLEIRDGKPFLESHNRHLSSSDQKELAPATLGGLTPEDGDKYLRRLEARYSGGYFWAEFIRGS